MGIQVLGKRATLSKEPIMHIPNIEGEASGIFPMKGETDFNEILVSVFKDPRMIDFEHKYYETADEAIWHLLRRGEAIHLNALASCLDFKVTSEQPSIRAMLSGGIKREFIIPVIMKVLEELSFYFSEKPNSRIEELAWQVFEEYPSYSLLDVLLFTQKCKRKQYATDFEHPESKGLNPGHFRNWLNKFDEERDEFLRKERIKIREENKLVHPLVMKRLQPAVDNLKRKIHLAKKKKSKLFHLKCKSDKARKKLSLREKFINEYVNFYLIFQKENYQKTKEELRKTAEKQLASLMKEWKDRLKGVGDFSDSKEQRNSTVAESYLRSKIGAEIRSIQKLHKQLTTAGILETGLSLLIESQNILTVDSLLKALPTIEVNTSEDELTGFKVVLVLHLQKRISKGWKIHESRIVDGEVSYMSQERFFKLAALNWVRENCLPNSSDTQNDQR